jgi:hypothetical protein
MLCKPAWTQRFIAFAILSGWTSGRNRGALQIQRALRVAYRMAGMGCICITPSLQTGRQRWAFFLPFQLRVRFGLQPDPRFEETPDSGWMNCTLSLLLWKPPRLHLGLLRLEKYWNITALDLLPFFFLNNCHDRKIILHMLFTLAC